MEQQREHRIVSQVELRTLLAEFVSGFRTQGEAAVALGVSDAFLSQMLTGVREVSTGIAGQLGWQKQTVYVRT
jgi:hypothetical protein